MQVRPSQIDAPSKRTNASKSAQSLISGVLLLLLLANISVFAAGTFAEKADLELQLQAFSVMPQKLLVTDGAPLSENLALAGTYMSHAFLHGDFRHLVLNMLMLWMFGQPLAIRLGTNDPANPTGDWTGGFLFLAFYLSAAVFSAIIFSLLNVRENVMLIGASGAVSAVAGAAIRVMMRRYQPTGLRGGKPLALVDWKIMGVTVFYILANLAVLLPAAKGSWLVAGDSEVAWEVHVAGFIYGLLMFGFFDSLSRGTERRIEQEAEFFWERWWRAS